MTQETLDIRHYLEARNLLREETDNIRLLNAYKRLIADLLEEWAAEQTLVYTSAYTRNAFLGHQFNFHETLRYSLQRIGAAKDEDFHENSDDWIALSEAVFEELIRLVSGETPKPIALPVSFLMDLQECRRTDKVDLRKVVMLGPDKEGKRIKTEDAESGLALLLDPSKQTSFLDGRPVFEQLMADGLFPMEANGLGVTIQNGEIIAQQWVFDPDYLVDVSTISESFKSGGTLIEMQIINRFRPRLPSKHIILGNLVNYFLDEMVRDPSLTFEDLIKHVFSQQPLGLALLQNDVVRELVEKLEQHYKRMRYVLEEVFPFLGIRAEDSLLEPSFLSDRYGIQGRLDVLTQREGRPVIIELKSGRPFQENSYGLSGTHYIQTLLYDLLIRAAHDNRVEPENYILYSSVSEKSLRQAPRSMKLQAMALELRNRYILLDRKMTEGGDLDPKWLSQLVDPDHPGVWGFTKKDLDQFQFAYRQLGKVERAYLLHYAGFVAREQRISKTGSIPYRQTKGFASLWQADIEDKIAQFDMLAYLRWKDMDRSDEQPVLSFQKTAESNELSNFRAGDIGILYGHSSADSPLKQQLYRGTIIAIDHEKIEFRLRSKQIQEIDLQAFEFWHIERDVLDSGFNNQYRQLGEWMKLTSSKRELLLGIRPPHEPHSPMDIGYIPHGLNDRQATIFRKVIHSKEYFLLWGPPGTGKTSVLLREISRFWLDQTDDNILLLAFTNRAVDEICESLESFGFQDYVRVGSRYSTGERFREKLLKLQMTEINRRDELLNFIRDKRVFVSTVASIISKSELLHIKNFETLVVDEASQVTEPMLSGLLGRFERFVMIGDHRQLPAVVQQDDGLLDVKHPGMRQLGFHRLSDSLFERLYNRAIAEGWEWAYDQLSHQGRMHEDLMVFPNRQFYGGSLELLEGVEEVMKRQIRPVAELYPEDPDSRWAAHRLFYFNMPEDHTDPLAKTNEYEARAIAAIISDLQNHFEELTGKEIGIITPYRSQIARIVMELKNLELGQEQITVDTVERYQGGARDIIILSLCLNKPRQLKQLVNTSSEGVDRKLNVAVTRAREQLIVLGNEEIMRQDENYNALIDHIRENGYSGDLEDLVRLETE